MKHNSYFDGKVQSLALNTDEGIATVGVMAPGKFTFSTNSQEHMYITAGSLKVKLPGEDWKQINKGQKFVIEANASFDVDVTSDVAYLCYYK